MSPTFIGRGEALTTAAEMLRRIEAGRPSHVLVAGEAGIGKTRFTEAVTELADAGGFLVLRGGCIHLESGELSYAPIGEALRSLARRLDPPRLAAVVAGDGPLLARIAPVLAPREAGALEASTLEAGSTEAARGRLLDALLGLLGRLSLDAPVLLVVEDLHWADSASLDTLAFLLRNLRDERVGLSLTFRSDELHRRHPLRRWLGEVERLGTVERLELGPFTPAETAELIGAIRASEPSPDLAQQIRDRSDGNPFFIEELLATTDTHVGLSAMPPSLRDILLARIDGVPDDAQAILGVAAVAGRTVDAALLAQLSALAPAAFDAGLTACVERRLLVADPGGVRHRLAFRHALIAEVVYDVILPDERIRLHRTLAEALAARLAAPGPREPGRWAEVAGHWDAARDEVKTFHAALRAADEAEHSFAWDAALVQYRRALAGWELVADPEAVAGFDRIELLSRAAAVDPLGGRGSAVPLLREAIAEADRRGDTVRGAVLRSRLGHALWIGGHPVEARAAHRDALAMVPAEPPTVERGWILAHLAQVLMLDGSERESTRIAEEAIAVAREVGDRQIEAHALASLAGCLACLGRCDLGAEVMERALAIALDIGDPTMVGRAYVNAVEALATSGRDERALEVGREGVERTATLGIGATYGSLIGFQAAVVLYERGRWAEATALLVDGRLGAPAFGTEVYGLANWVEAVALTVGIDVGTGDWDTASRKLTWLDEQLRGGFESEYQYTGPYACARAELALWQGRPRDAVAAGEEALPRLERTDDLRFRLRLARLGMRAAADLAEMARDRRDAPEEARAHGIAAALRARSDPALAAIGGMDGGLALELAAEEATIVAEETRLRGASDPVAWREAAERWTIRGRPYHRGYARFREAEASLVGGDRVRATEALSDAREVAAELGAGPLLGAVEALGRRARIPLERGATAPGQAARPLDEGDALAGELGLTSREREVLELLARGLTNRQIADTLFISVYTAGIHVSRILAKLGVASRTEAASKAYRLGLVTR